MPSETCSGTEVVATFVAWPGWRASIDGKPVDIFKTDDQFIRVSLNGGSKLVLTFEPYSSWYLLSCVLFWVLFVAVSIKMASKWPE